LNGASIFFRLEEIGERKLFSLRGFRTAKPVFAYLKLGRLQKEMRDVEWN
jgi:hypothetical protein